MAETLRNNIASQNRSTSTLSLRQSQVHNRATLQALSPQQSPAPNRVTPQALSPAISPQSNQVGCPQAFRVHIQATRQAQSLVASRRQFQALNQAGNPRRFQAPSRHLSLALDRAGSHLRSRQVTQALRPLSIQGKRSNLY